MTRPAPASIRRAAAAATARCAPDIPVCGRFIASPAELVPVPVFGSIEYVSRVLSSSSLMTIVYPSSASSRISALMLVFVLSS